MDRQRADALVAELGAQLGIEGAALGPGGVASLALDDGAMIVTIGHNPAAGTLELMLCLDELVPSGAEAARLLAANFGWIATGGAAFALEPATGALVLQRRCAAQELAAPDALRLAIEGLVATAEGVAQSLAAGRDGAAMAEPAPPPGGPLGGIRA